MIKKKIENHNFVGAGAHKVGKAVSLWHNFHPHFPNIQTMRKGNMSKNVVFVNIKIKICT